MHVYLQLCCCFLKTISLMSRDSGFIFPLLVYLWCPVNLFAWVIGVIIYVPVWWLGQLIVQIDSIHVVFMDFSFLNHNNVNQFLQIMIFISLFWTILQPEKLVEEGKKFDAVMALEVLSPFFTLLNASWYTRGYVCIHYRLV